MKKKHTAAEKQSKKEKTMILVSAGKDSVRFAEAILSVQNEPCHILYVTQDKTLSANTERLMALQELMDHCKKYGAELSFCCKENTALYIEQFTKKHGITQLIAEPEAKRNMWKEIWQHLVELLPDPSTQIRMA